MSIRLMGGAILVDRYKQLFRALLRPEIAAGITIVTMLSRRLNEGVLNSVGGSLESLKTHAAACFCR